MVYGSGDQSPTFCLGSGSEAWDISGSQRWDWGSSIKFGNTGIIYGIRDQNFSKKWAQRSSKKSHLKIAGS